jgi:hypothetical protein
MTTHQSIASRQRNGKKYNLAPSKSLEALMVRIDWTDAKTVRIEARQDFTMAASTVRILHGEYTVLADAPVNVQAGQVIYFVKSDSFENYYYVLLYIESRSAFTCSCPQSFHFHRQCQHQQHAMVYVTHRSTRRVELEHEIGEEWAIHLEDDLRQAAQERQYENLCVA